MIDVFAKKPQRRATPSKLINVMGLWFNIKLTLLLKNPIGLSLHVPKEHLFSERSGTFDSIRGK
jgi:hypothetical protein